jgi:O-antigen ligase
MKTLGWDDHYFRITSFLLDPGFAGIVLVLGLVIALQKRRLPLILGFIMTILLTYSRASYLAAMAGCGYLLLRKIRVQNTVKILAIILLSLFFLPRPAGEGVNLLRTRSISARALNYAQTFEIIETNPLFGIGFNNICFAKHKLDPGLKSVNSCSGADNSFLFVLATTGLVGGVIFIHEILKLVKGTSHDEFGEIFKGSGVALLTHSFFSNTIFYISTMAWFAILIAISRGAHHRE